MPEIDFSFNAETCYPPWTELRKRCYHVVDVPSGKWDDAQAQCQSLNSQMMIISTEEEDEFTAQLIKVFHFYLVTKHVRLVGCG